MITLKDMSCPYCGAPLSLITNTRWKCDSCTRETLVYVRTDPNALKVGDSFDVDGMEFMITSLENREVCLASARADSHIPDEVTIEDERYRVTCIAGLAFAKCKGMTTVKIPSFMYVQRTHLFAEMEIADTFHIPENLEELGTYMFSGCKGLRTITIPAKYTRIPMGMFSNCVDLESVIFEGRVEEIGDYAFNNCKKLKSITSPWYTGQVEDGPHLDEKRWIELPDSIEKLGAGVFLDSDLDFVFTNAKSIGKWATKPVAKPYDWKEVEPVEVKVEPIAPPTKEPTKKKGLFGFLRR